jgi:hypothetical protein
MSIAARPLALLQNEHASTGLREECRGAQTTKAASDDDDIVGSLARLSLSIHDLTLIVRIVIGAGTCLDLRDIPHRNRILSGRRSLFIAPMS